MPLSCFINSCKKTSKQKSLRYVITTYWRRMYASFLWSHKSYAKLAVLCAYLATILATWTFTVRLANITIKTRNCDMQSYMGCKHSLSVNLPKGKAASSVLINWNQERNQKIREARVLQIGTLASLQNQSITSHHIKPAEFLFQQEHKWPSLMRCFIKLMLFCFQLLYM